MRERTRQGSGVAASVLVLVVGLVLFLGLGQEPVTYGWFAYQPRGEAPPGSLHLALNAWGWTGAALVVLGIIGLLVAAVMVVRVRRSAARR